MTGVKMDSSRTWKTLERFASAAMSCAIGLARARGERRRNAREKKGRREVISR